MRLSLGVVSGDLDALPGLELWHVDPLEDGKQGCGVTRGALGNTVVLSSQVSSGHHKVHVKRAFGVKDDRLGTPLGRGPEGGPGGGGLILGKVVEELTHRVVEQLLEGEPGPGHAVVPAARLFVDEHLLDKLQRLDGLGPLEPHGLLEEVCLLQVLLGGQGCLGEGALEQVPGPLQGVLDLVGEVLEGADGDGLLRGIARGAVRLGEVWDDDLGVALGAQSAGL